MNLQDFLSSNLKSFKKYTAGASLPEIARKLGIDIKDIVKLDANENFHLDESWLREKLIEAAKRAPLIIYPDKHAVEGRETLARELNLDPEQILIGNGSDDLLLTLYHAFTDTQSQVITIHPTFSMYKWFANLMGCELLEIPLIRRDFSLNEREIIDSVSNKTKFIIIPSPNNPTGNQFDRQKLLKIIETVKCIVVIDEAYTDFSGGSLMDELSAHSNLIILKTFSKSWGLAGIRLGYAVASKEMISLLKSVQVPFTTNVISQALIPLMIREKDYLEKAISEVIDEREWLAKELSKFKDLKVYPSKANFLLVELTSEQLTIRDLIDGLFKQGILIRDQSQLPGLERCARITVGTREMNQRLLDAIYKLMNDK
ncbi:MAG: histidinol-phosphate transaminase [Candidatus Helarchaeales archaeon]